MKYELSHDVLALKAYERASVDDKALRKVERLIRERYAFYRQRKTLLSKDDLDYISPYIDQVTISEEEEDFIEKSRRALKRRNRLLILMIVAIFLALSGLTAFALIQSQKAEEEKENAIAASKLAEENEKKAQEEKENALVASKLAFENEQKAQQEKENALVASKLAEENAQKALENERKALKSEKEAQLERDNALQARNKADENAQLARANEERARRNQERADSLRILSLAQSLMAIATQVEDSSLKVKLAIQAYDFHKQQNGDPYDPVIHDGLRTALLAANWKNSVHSHQSAITGMAFTPDRKHFFSTARDGKLIKWSWNETLNIANSTVLEHPLVTQGGMSLNNKWLAVSGDQAPNLQIFSLNDFPRPWSEKISIEESINDLVFHPTNEHQLILSTSQGLESANIQSTRAEENTFSFSDAITKEISVHPSAKWIAGIKEGGTLEIRALNEGKTLQVFHETNDVHSISFSNDGKFLAVGDQSGKVWLYNFPNGDHIATLSGHAARVSKVAFYQQEGYTFLVSAGYDGKAQLWYWGGQEKNSVSKELSTRLPIVLKADEKWEFELTFSPDGKHILMGNRNGIIQQWLINIDDMAELLKKQVSDIKLTQEEWRQYLKGEAYDRK